MVNYRPSTAVLGGVPTKSLDDPICAVLLALFATSAAVNMFIFQVNRRRDHKFLFSAIFFGFSVMRIIALTMRIVWASHPSNPNIIIAASILTFAGTIVLFIINLLFAQRLLRAYRPRIGWSRPVTLLFRATIALVPMCLVMVVPTTVDSFFTTSANARRMERDVQLVAGVLLAAIAFLPMPILLLTLFAPPRPPSHGPVESFGRGRLTTKAYLLAFASALLFLGAGFRIGVNFSLRPIQHPAWFHSKACFYCFNFVIEIIVVYTYTISRFDQRFHVPNGASAPGHYSAGSSINDEATMGDMGDMPSPKSSLSGAPRRLSLADRVNTEADVFGSDRPPTAAKNLQRSARQWEAQAERELEKANRGEAV